MYKIVDVLLIEIHLSYVTREHIPVRRVAKTTIPLLTCHQHFNFLASILLTLHTK